MIGLVAYILARRPDVAAAGLVDVVVAEVHEAKRSDPGAAWSPWLALHLDRIADDVLATVAEWDG